MGAIAAARRTQSSFPAYVASTDPSNLSVVDAPQVLGQVGRLPGVRHAESGVPLNAVPLQADGKPAKPASASARNVFIVGSLDGLYFDQDRATPIQGRLADPTRPDEAIMTADAAHAFGWRVGQTIRFGFYDAKQRLRTQDDVTMVGIVALNSTVVQDDAQRSATYVILTPALMKSLGTCCDAYGGQLAFTGLRLEHGSRDIAAAETAFERILPPDASFYLQDASITEAKAERSIKPESIALGVFGAIAALAALLIAGQVIAREIGAGAGDRDVMRELGATRSMTASDGLIGVLGAIVIGALLAAGVTIAGSPLSPLGPVRAVYPTRGIAFDWTVLGVGVGILIVTLSGIALALAYRGTPRRAARVAKTRRSRVASAAAASGLPVPAVAGVRFALESGRGRGAAPVRSAILGTTLAVVVVVGTITFGASLRTLVSHPALYGWNWNYELETAEGGGAIPPHAAATLLGRDPDVRAWTGVFFDSLRVDALTVPIIGETPRASVQPRLLSGTGFDASSDIVLGPSTLSQLHKHVGDTVEGSYATCIGGERCPGAKTRTKLRIVGTATMPAVGPSLGLHVSMGTGAIVSEAFIPRENRVAGVNAIFVRLRAGSNPATALTALRRVATSLSTSDVSVSALSVQRPAEIVNYRSMGDTPVILGAALAVGAFAALALTLIASVRRRRRDLALLKVLGFRRRQLSAVVSWQATVAVVIGIVIGIPLGVSIGRALWDLFAREIDAVPHPTAPALAITLVAVGALILANAVALLPGLQAARTRTAVLLRDE
jgi:hypothetical protein